MNTCDTCAHWEIRETISEEPLYHRCQHPTLGSNFPTPFDGAAVVYGEPGNEGVIATGPKFGCIHHQPK